MGNSNSSASKPEGSRISLPDLLVKVPDLLPEHLLQAWQTRGEGISVLRMVSKDMCRIAQQAIQSCAVDLSFWDHPFPDQVVSLLGDSCLRKLVITIHITDGRFLLLHFHEAFVFCSLQVPFFRMCWQRDALL